MYLSKRYIRVAKHTCHTCTAFAIINLHIKKKQVITCRQYIALPLVMCFLSDALEFPRDITSARGFQV